MTYSDGSNKTLNTMKVNKIWSRIKKYSIPNKVAIIGLIVGLVGILLFFFSSPEFKLKRTKLRLDELPMEF